MSITHSLGLQRIPENPEPIELTDLEVGNIVRDIRDNEEVVVVSIRSDAITYQCKDGRFTVFPDDFSRLFTYVD